MSQELDSAWAVVRFARESRRANPRGRRRGSKLNQSNRKAQVSYEEILERTDEGISHLRHLARSLREASYSDGEWDDQFRERWAQIVGDAGQAIADPDEEVAPLRDDLTALSIDMSDDRGLPRDSWPTYGSLIASVRHIVVVVDDVASARRAREGGAKNPRVSS